MDFDAFRRRVGANVRRARWAAGLTLEELAAKTATYRVIGELERGRGNPQLVTLFELARELNVTVADLLDVETRPRYEPLRERRAVPPRRVRRKKSSG